MHLFNIVDIDYVPDIVAKALETENESHHPSF